MVSDSEIIYTYMDKYQSAFSEINNNSVNNYTIGKYNFRTKEKIEKSKSKSMDVWTGTQLTRNGILLHEIDKEMEIKKVNVMVLPSTHKGMIDKIGGFSRVYSFSFENGFELLNEMKMIPYELKGDKGVSHYSLPGSDSSNLKAYFDIPPLVCQDGRVVFGDFDGHGNSGRYYAERYSGELLYGREIITNDCHANLDSGYCLNKSLAKKPICSFSNYGAPKYAVENKVYDGIICAVSSDGNRILVDEGLVNENKNGELYYYKNGESIKIDDANLNSMLQYKILR